MNQSLDTANAGDGKPAPAAHPPGRSRPAPRCSTPSSFDAWAEQPGAAMAVFAEDPERYKETLDLAVIVPELHARRAAAAFASRCCRPTAARLVARRYGFAPLAGVRDAARRPLPRRRRRHPRLGRLPRRARSPAGGGAEPAADGRHPGERRRRGRALRVIEPRSTACARERSRSAAWRAEPDEAIVYMPMPREMATFEMPSVPEPGPGSDVAGARDVLAQFLRDFGAWLDGDAELPALDLEGRAAGIAARVNETLGEGEVAATCRRRPRDPHPGDGVPRRLARAALRPRRRACCTTTCSPRRCRRSSAGWPRERAATGCARSTLPAGAMNVPALIHELQDAMDRSGPEAAAHVINLTLLPLSPEDTAHIDARARRRRGGDPFARLRQLPHQQHRGARRLARAVLQQHADADPQHDRGHADARGGGRGARRPRRDARAARRTRRSG